MARALTCRDMGVDCSWEGTADGVDEVIEAASEHTKQVHGVKELPSEMVASMKRAIKDA
jgi:predicted small metal-binding protein